MVAKFPLAGRVTINRTVTEKLRNHELCVRWVPKMPTDQRKEQRMSSGRAFLDATHEKETACFPILLRATRRGYLQQRARKTAVNAVAPFSFTEIDKIRVVSSFRWEDEFG